MNKTALRIIIPVVVITVFILIMGARIFHVVPAGFNGVLFDKFTGINKDKVYSPGLAIIAPWTRMIEYDIRLQSDVQKMQVLSRNGLNIICELSYFYRPQQAKLGYLFSEIDRNYKEAIIIPQIRSATREVIGKYLPEELYSTKRQVIQDEIMSIVSSGVKDKYINVEEVLIREVKLPASLETAIEKKLKQEQESLEYEYKLERAKLEADRQRIEAEGKAKANEIVSKSLTSAILKEKGIEATLELAKSPNTKVVVVGGGQDGLPLILGNN